MMGLTKTIYLLSVYIIIFSLSACGGGSSSSGGSGGDSGGNSGDPIDLSGTWKGPCINNPKTLASARQELQVISNDTLKSTISIYDWKYGCSHETNGQPSHNVSSSGSISSILAPIPQCNDSDVSLTQVNIKDDYGNPVEAPAGMSEQDIIDLFTGSRNDFLPDTTQACIKANGNLMFAGQEYIKDGFNNNPVVNLAAAKKTSWTITRGGQSTTHNAYSVGSTTGEVFTFREKNKTYPYLVFYFKNNGPGEYTDATLSDIAFRSNNIFSLRIFYGPVTEYQSTHDVVGDSTGTITKDKYGLHFSTNSPVTLKKTSGDGAETLAINIKNLHLLYLNNFKN